MWPNLLEDPDAALALWEVAMTQQHATERRLEEARRVRNARSIQTLTWELDELRYRADLLLANAVQARRDSAPAELPVAVRRALSCSEAVVAAGGAREHRSMRAEERPDRPGC